MKTEFGNPEFVIKVTKRMKKRTLWLLIVLMIPVFVPVIGTHAQTKVSAPHIWAGTPWVSDDTTTYSWQDDDPETPWGIERVFNGKYYGDNVSTKVQVAILDTGIDLEHPDLKANIKWAVDTTGQGISDIKGHGTHVAGTIGAVRDNSGVVGMYANVEIYAIKVLGNGGSGDWDDLIAGIDLAMKGPDGVKGTDDDADVISMSLGASSDPGQAVHDKIIEAYKAGIVLVAAAGNEGDGDASTDEVSYPAAYPEVISVGAVDKDDTVAYFSNTGSHVEVVAPGVSIYSTYKNEDYATMSGTSMATPHVSGLIALYIALHGKLPVGTFDDTGTNTIRGWLHSTAIDLGPSGWDSAYGYGLIQA